MAGSQANDLMVQKYDFSLKEETKLYHRAKREQWDAADLPWELGTALDPIQRAAGAQVLSNFLYGEQAAMLIASQLVSQVQDMEIRACLATQVMDEIRHIEAFNRYIVMLGKVQNPNEHIREFVERLLAVQNPEEKFIGLHLLLEGLALEVFHEAAQRIADPLLKIMLNKTTHDESRHIAFGTTYLKKLVKKLDEETKAQLVTRHTEYSMLLVGLVIDEAETSAQFGLDLAKITERNINGHLHRMAGIGLWKEE
ncbi:MAG: ferritin-like domain-containing protein [Chloroflexi bacterium]|uniref:propane 2-monooxygenase n=1 Tax=Candidatus Chlorohelix allophototropha TaxID=3003348 RepID=A0A8T7M9L3_9CHLR|nr:ferritin-like domain-containing protein [Chloroflexota bacterium]WJW68810.1 ferritin-like domain-containing protein [Chloroflexota bacterium L227-S17]